MEGRNFACMETEKKIVESRTFAAPVEMVWRAFVEPELVMRWWGPDHFTAPVARMDFRIGGRSVVSMRAPASMGGQETYSSWDYIYIDAYRRIEFIQRLADSQGHPVPPVSLGMPADFPQQVRTVVDFEKLDNDHTRLTYTQYADMGQMEQMATLGLQQSLNKMGHIFGQYRL